MFICNNVEIKILRLSQDGLHNTNEITTYKTT